jgi:hypothetical protein
MISSPKANLVEENSKALTSGIPDSGQLQRVGAPT